jgi:capsular exopolysaccharide synthesis family protein
MPAGPDPYVLARSDRAVGEALARRDEQAAQIRSLERRFGPRNSVLINAKAQLEDYESALQMAIDRALQFMPAIDLTTGGNAGQARLLRQRDSMVRLRDSLQKEVQQLARRTLEIDNLRAELALKEEQLATVKGRIEAMNVESAVSGRISVISEGERPFAPKQDKRMQFAAVGGMGGFGVGIAAVAAFGLLRSRIRYSDDAARVPVVDGPPPPVLGVLPSLPDEKAKGDETSSLREDAAQTVHRIRALLQRRTLEGGTGSVTITSAGPSSGKTSLSSALAISFASGGAKTLLIDCDLTAGGLSHRMRDDQDVEPAGLPEVLAGADPAEAAEETVFDRLDVLGRGTLRRQHAGHLTHQVLQAVIRRAREHYDVVIIDAGPVLGSLEAPVAASSVDATLLIASRGEDAGNIRRAGETLLLHSAHIAGIVFNRASDRDYRSTSYYSSYRSGGDRSPFAAATKDQLSPLEVQAAQMSPLAFAVATTLPDELNRSRVSVQDEELVA